MNITAQEAKTVMDSRTGYIILDVRTQQEYEEGHIPGQLILVYCRSGRRSKLAAEALVELGYTNIMEFGGIIDWPYEVE